MADAGEVLAAGDIVWLSFTASYIEGKGFWNPEFRPVEVVRVGRIPESVIAFNTDDFMYPSMDDYKPLCSGKVEFQEGK